MPNTAFLPFLLQALALLGASFGLGEGLLRLMRTRPLEPYFRLFLALTLGLSVLVGSYAAVRTKGVSIMLPLLGLMLLLLPALKPKADEPDSSLVDRPAPAAHPTRPWPAAGLVLLAALILFATRWALLYDPASPFLLTPFQDYIYYGRVSEALNRTGVEARSLEQLFPQFLNVQPYHYYELWLNALLLRVSSHPAVWSLYLSTYTVLTTLVFVGFRALLAYFGWRGVQAAGLALGMLLVSGVYWPAFELHSFAEGGRYVATSLLLLEPKLSAIYIFLLLGSLLLLHRQWRAAGLALAALPLVFVTTIPAVAGALTGLVLWLRRRLHQPQLLGLLLPFFLSLLYLAAFYLLQLPAESPPGPGNAPLLMQLPALGQWRTLVNVLGGTLINVALYAGAYALLFVVLGWGRLRASGQRWSFGLKVLLGGLLLSTGLSALAFTLTAHLPDSYQLLGNTFPPFLALAVAGIAAALLRGSSRLRRTMALAGLLALAWVNHRRLFTHDHSMHKVTRFSPAFLQQVRGALAEVGNRGGFFMADADYETIYHLTQDTFTRGTYVSNFSRDYTLVSLSAPDLPTLRTDPRFARDTAAAVACIRRASLARFVQLNARQGRRWPPDSAQYQLVVQHKLRFLCLAPAVALPATLQPLVQARYQDAVSGEAFVVLKPYPPTQAAPSASASF
ncbi:hypothetical protein GCM10023185_44720 [Hymenobacter saemangeumensis]|uniref:Glycosyltransferase RgtA/B/C/D-like domain-containing protein n=1 Tax=Hymenobacter saemangeumensis TaxID=1084522 RepID=A0ABP8ISD1_9BACT